MCIDLHPQMCRGDYQGPYCAFSEYSFQNTYNLASIAAIDLNFGMIIHVSSRYTHKEFQAPPIPGVGEASERVDCVEKSPIYAALWIREVEGLYTAYKTSQSLELLWP